MVSLYPRLRVGLNGFLAFFPLPPSYDYRMAVFGGVSSVRLVVQPKRTGEPNHVQSSSRPLTRAAACRALPVAAVVLLLAASPKRAKRNATPRADTAAAETAIRAAVESYVAAYNRGDAQAVADHWGENAEWTSPAGQTAVGRKAIAKAMEDLFAQNKGVTIEVSDVKVRLVTADVAMEEGNRARAVRRGCPPSDATYIAIHVQRDGKWKLDSVRETEIADTQQPGEGLRQLDWMIGEWVDSGPDAVVETNVQWTKNKTFLTASFRVSVPDMDDLEGTQVIGWDPKNETIRSWMFDSDGGFGEGVWTQKGDRWIVKFSQTLADGRTASAINIYRLIDADHYGWQSVGRKVEGEYAPNIDEVTVVRKGAKALAPVKQKRGTDGKGRQEAGSTWQGREGGGREIMKKLAIFGAVLALLAMGLWSAEVFARGGGGGGGGRSGWRRRRRRRRSESAQAAAVLRPRSRPAASPSRPTASPSMSRPAPSASAARPAQRPSTGTAARAPVRRRVPAPRPVRVLQLPARLPVRVRASPAVRRPPERRPCNRRSPIQRPSSSQVSNFLNMPHAAGRRRSLPAARRRPASCRAAADPRQSPRPAVPRSPWPAAADRTRPPAARPWAEAPGPIKVEGRRRRNGREGRRRGRRQQGRPSGRRRRLAYGRAKPVGLHRREGQRRESPSGGTADRPARSRGVRGPGGNVVTAGRGASFVNGQFVGGNAWRAVNGAYTRWGAFGPGWIGGYPGGWWPGKWAVATTAWAGAVGHGRRLLRLRRRRRLLRLRRKRDLRRRHRVLRRGAGRLGRAVLRAGRPDRRRRPAGQNEEWLPLGVFAVVTEPTQTQTDKVVQLALNKEGVIRGNLHDATTDKVIPVTGAVDKKTQRVAIKMEGNDSMVVETGLYNLTNDEVPVLIHFGADRQEPRTLMRLKPPEEQQPKQ